MSKRILNVDCSLISSASVKRSMRSVPKPCSLSARATDWFRGLCRLLPEPWAKRTMPCRGLEGSSSSPFNLTPPAGIDTSDLSAWPTDRRERPIRLVPMDCHRDHPPASIWTIAGTRKGPTEPRAFYWKSQTAAGRSKLCEMRFATAHGAAHIPTPASAYRGCAHRP